MKHLTCFLLLLCALGCGKEIPSPIAATEESFSSFGSLFHGSWVGTGEYLDGSETECEVVKITIEPAPNRPNQIAVRGAEIKCAGVLTGQLKDRTLLLKEGIVYENAEQVGSSSESWSADSGGIWMNYRIESPEPNAPAKYVSLTAFPAGTFTDTPRPVLFFDVSTNPTGSNRIFGSSLKPQYP